MIEKSVIKPQGQKVLLSNEPMRNQVLKTADYLVGLKPEAIRVLASGHLAQNSHFFAQKLMPKS